jgi:hypothetical protein
MLGSALRCSHPRTPTTIAATRSNHRRDHDRDDQRPVLVALQAKQRIPPAPGENATLPSAPDPSEAHHDPGDPAQHAAGEPPDAPDPHSARLTRT